MVKKIITTLKWVVIIFFTAIILVVIFFTIQTNLRESKTSSEAAPSTGRFVEANGQRIFIQEAGPVDGDAVLLIPATAAWGETWRGTIDVLAQNGYNVFTIDLPPFGFSEKPATDSYSRVDQAQRILATLEALNIEKVTLVGHSIAGRTTIETALRDSGRIKNLVLVSASAGIAETSPTTVAQKGLFARVLEIRPIRSFLMGVVTSPPFTRSVLERIVFDPKSITDDLIDTFRAPLVVNNSSATMGDWLLFVTSPKETGLGGDISQYQNLNMPTLIVWGRNDIIIPLTEGELLKKLIPHAQLNIFENVNHAPHLEKTDEFNRVLLDFLKKNK